MEPSQIRAGLAAAVKPIEGLATSSHLPDSVDPPVFIAGEVEITPDQVAEGGLDEMRVTCHLYTSTADDKSGQVLLDKYLATAGPDSVRARLLADHTLGGLVQMLWIARITGYGKYRIAGLEQPEPRYYGARIFVHVQGP